MAVEEANEMGAWAPLTREGTLLVDGVLASSYASFPHALSQLVFAPVKALSRLLLDDETSQHRDGTRAVVAAIKEAGTSLGLRQKNLQKEQKTSVCGMKDFMDGAKVAAVENVGKHIEL